MSSSLLTADTSQWKELATRESDGLTVSLLWSRESGAVKVTVADSKLDHDFELHVRGADALAAFYHPFAFAAAEGMALELPDRATLDLQPQV